MTARSAIVVGAGIGGLTASAALRRAGVEVTLCERAPELRAAGFGLAVQSNAMTALRTLDLGLDDALLRAGGQVSTFSFRRTDGSVLRRIDLAPIDAALGAPSVVLARRDLHDILLAAAGPELRVQTGAEVAGFEADPGGVTVRLADGRELHADMLIGADGIHSAVRAQLHGPADPRPGGFLCWLGLSPFFPDWLRAGESVHFWDAGRRFGLHDCGGGIVYWWATENAPAALTADGADDKAALLRRFTDWTPDINEIIGATADSDVIAVPALDRDPLPWWGSGPVTLLGDAAHPMLPSLGQGANSAIEDAVVLAHAVATIDDPAAALRAYQRRRLSRTTDLVTGSRSLGRIEQSANPVLTAARSRIIRHAGDRRIAAFMADPMSWTGFGDAGPAAALPRPLSRLERWHWTVDRISPLNIGTRIRLTGPLDVAALQRALNTLARRHPLLHSAVHTDGPKPSFVPQAPRPVPLRIADGSTWVDEADRELAAPFGGDDHLLRATLIPAGDDAHDLLLMSTYTVADGATMLELGRQLGQLLDAPEDGRWYPEIPAPPGPEALMPPGFAGLPGAARAAGRLLADGIADRGGPPLRRLPAERAVAPAQRRTRLVHRTLSGDDARRVLKGCRERSVGVEAVAAAALARAAATVTRQPDARFAVSVSVLFGDQLAARPDPRATGCYQAMIGAPVAGGGPLWPAAQEFGARLRDGVAANRHLANLGSLGAMAAAAARFPQRVVSVLDEQGPGNLCVTVVDGAAATGRSGALELSGAQVISGMSVSGYLMLYLTVDADRIAVNLGYVEGIVSAERAEGLVEGVCGALRDC